MATLNDLLGTKGITLAEVRAHLEALPPAERVRQATCIGRAAQGVLWELAKNGPKVRSEDLVPADVAALAPIAFEGQNSMPLFRSFRKVFYRTTSGTVHGRNEGTLAPVVGDGYYSVVPGGEDGVYIDYTQLPEARPAGWPAIRRNDRGVSTFVFGFMKDYLRHVADGVFIGHAVKPVVGSQGYFVLARA